MMLDSLGERYGKLPSEVLEKASTLDLWVFDAAISYRNYIAQRENNKDQQNNQHIDPELLQKGLEKFRERQGKS